MKGENQSLKAYLQNMPCCLQVSGEDAYSFLQSQFSNDLSKGGDSFACYGLWLNAKGRVLADSVIVRFECENFYIFSENTEGLFIKEILENHIIADDVNIEAIQLVGSIFVNLSAAQVLGRNFELFKEEFDQDAMNYINIDFSTVAIFPRKRLDEDGFVFCFRDKEKFSLYKKALEEQSVHWLSKDEIHIQRLALGMPLVPNEIGLNDLAGEGDLVPLAASLTKGCYLGQEVVARLFHVGKPQRQLFVMTFNELHDEGNSIKLPLKIMIENRSLGELRTLYRDTNNPNKWYGVALLKVRYVDSVQSKFNLANHYIDSLCKLSEFSLSD